MNKTICTTCGKAIKNPHYLNGKAYGYTCYKKELALQYKRFEDEKNAFYQQKCFAAMQIFSEKKSNAFHDSICEQWNTCGKLTGKQMQCIIRGFSAADMVRFYCILFQIADDHEKWQIAASIESTIAQNMLYGKFMDDESVNEIMLCRYPDGIHYWMDTEDKVVVFSGNNGSLERHLSDRWINVLKIVKN